MDKDIIYRICGYAGLSLIVTGAFSYAALLSHPVWTVVFFCLGVVLETIHRFCGEESDYARSRDTERVIGERRLYRQRWIAVLLLYLSAAIMILPKGFYFGFYNNHSLWFVPFLIFTVVEVYCIFRLK